MTKRERAQVVELLRCGADAIRMDGLTSARLWVSEIEQSLALLCFGAEMATAESQGLNFYALTDDMRADLCLEAALRVEQGEWP